LFESFPTVLKRKAKVREITDAQFGSSKKFTSLDSVPFHFHLLRQTLASPSWFLQPHHQNHKDLFSPFNIKPFLPKINKAQ
jgi:hypothetical protein